MTVLSAAWTMVLLGCGPSLPGWVGEVSLRESTVPEPGEVHSTQPAEAVQDALIAGGWQAWPGVTDEFLVDSHILRLERDGTWADLRQTDDGVRLLRLEAPPEPRPVSAASDVAMSGLPVELEGAPQLAGLLGCQSLGQDGEDGKGRADVEMRAGRYQWSSGRSTDNGSWTLDGDTLRMGPPWSRTCPSVAGVGKGIPQLVTCGASDLLWCGGLAPGPTVAVVVDDVQAARSDSRVARLVALANQPLEDVPFPGDAVVYLARESEPAAGDSSVKTAIRLRYTDSVRVPRASPRGPERSYAMLAERLAYRIRRDLGVPVSVERVEAPGDLRAGVTIHTVVGASDEVTSARP